MVDRGHFIGLPRMRGMKWWSGILEWPLNPIIILLNDEVIHYGLLVKCRGWPPSRILWHVHYYIALLPGEHTQQSECSRTLNAGSVGLAWASLPNLCPHLCCFLLVLSLMQLCPCLCPAPLAYPFCWCLLVCLVFITNTRVVQLIPQAPFLYYKHSS